MDFSALAQLGVGGALVIVCLILLFRFLASRREEINASLIDVLRDFATSVSTNLTSQTQSLSRQTEILVRMEDHQRATVDRLEEIERKLSVTPPAPRSRLNGAPPVNVPRT